VRIKLLIVDYSVDNWLIINFNSIILIRKHFRIVELKFQVIGITESLCVECSERNTENDLYRASAY